MSGFVLLFIVFSHNYFARGGGGTKATEPVKGIMLDNSTVRLNLA
jgi:hypothetical protein